MTIVAFWEVGHPGFERDHLDNIPHEDAFRILWEKRKELFARFYDMESFAEEDAYDLRTHIGNADDFTVDYNDEELDGGFWCKALWVRSDFVREVIYK